MPAARIHVTLHFFGEIDRAALATLRAALGDRVAEPPFEVTLRAGGIFPATGRPRVLWLGTDAGSDPLTRLHAWIQPRVVGIGQPDRVGVYAPHVTIARIRRDPVTGRRQDPRGRGADAAAGRRAPIDAVTLFESVASATGPCYVPLARSRSRPTMTATAA